MTPPSRQAAIEYAPDYEATDDDSMLLENTWQSSKRTAFEAGWSARDGEVERLEGVLRKIQNSVALASWNVNPLFQEWSKQMNSLVDEALKTESGGEG